MPPPLAGPLQGVAAAASSQRPHALSGQATSGTTKQDLLVTRSGAVPESGPALPPPPRFRRAPCSVPLCPGSSPAMPRICLGAPVPVPVPVPVSVPGLDDGTVPTSGHRPWSRKWPIPEPRARPAAARLMWVLRVKLCPPCLRRERVGSVQILPPVCDVCVPVCDQ